MGSGEVRQRGSQSIKFKKTNPRRLKFRQVQKQKTGGECGTKSKEGFGAA